MESENPLTQPQAATPTRRFFPKPVHNTHISDHLGKEASVQRFYEDGIASNSRDIIWNDWAPPTLANPRKTKFEGAAIQLYHRHPINKQEPASQPHGKFNSVREFYVSKITIQSPFIRSELEATFAKYGLVYDTDRAAHSLWPHRALYFSREIIAKVSETSDNSLTREHCVLLGTEVENALADILDLVEELKNTNEITFPLLWTLFPEGSIFATRLNNHIKAFRVKRYFPNNPFRLECEAVAFDGFRYGVGPAHLTVALFEGRVPVDKVPGLPIYNLGREEAMRNYLLERGAKSLDFQHIHYVSYVPSKEDDKPRSESLQGSWSAGNGGINAERIIIDTFRYNQTVKRPPLEPLRGYNLQDGEVGGDAGEENEALVEAREKRRPNKVEQENNRKVVLEDEENLLLMIPELVGFSLTRAVWTGFKVEDVHPIRFDDKIFEKVVFDTKKKELLRTLVEYHSHQGHKYDELITEKGQCLLILLTGESGTGKTLMAECLADYLKRPLIRILSTTGNSTIIEQEYKISLSTTPDVIRYAADWGAIVLFDEVDFENPVVKGTFLRQVEYFKGTILCTSNVTNFFNPAVTSRAQIHLKFPPLTAEMRREVWHIFNSRLPSDVEPLSVSDLERLSTWQMNGRQIKNAMNLAVDWCHVKKVRLTAETVEDIIDLSCPTVSRGSANTHAGDLMGL